VKVVILAGGLGSRLSEETVVKPKPMVEIGGSPILWHIMKTYSAHGFSDFTVALGYKGHVIKDYFLNYLPMKSDLSVNLSTGKVEHRNTHNENWTVDLVDTGSDTLTGGRIHRLESLLRPKGTFMVTYGDGVANVNISELLKFHKRHGKIATVTAVRPPARFGAISIENGKVLDFKEKPQIGEGWINGGFFVFEPQFFDYLSGDSTILERAPLENLTRDGQLMAFQHEGFWHPMDTVRDRDYLNGIWQNKDAPWKVWDR
jgi:glucose-1-phosphate cytidylyltransferase